MSAEPPKVICGMLMLQQAFYEHAKKRGDRTVLTNAEFAEMLRKECCVELQDSQQKEDFFKKLDFDGDGFIDFQEFCVQMATFMMLMGPDK
uniref:protein S100-G-like n=1 Tax=Doryrhamphus excisus TaxID=161450 RepID=UPI0025AE139E|nr:protein S100-G-like [Doryrhamphus excisus]